MTIEFVVCSSCNKRLTRDFNDVKTVHYHLESDRIGRVCSECHDVLYVKKYYSFCSFKCLSQKIEELKKRN